MTNEQKIEAAYQSYPHLREHPAQIGLMAQLPQGYVQPVPTEEYPFRPGCGGNSIWAHLRRLSEFARLAPRKIIVEVGVGCCDGSTHALDLGLQQNTNDGEGIGPLHIGVDLHEQPDGFWKPQGADWEYISGNSNDAATVDKVWERLSEFADFYDQHHGKTLYRPGILYIDTEHSYECLYRELAPDMWPSLGGPDTLYLFHDVTGFPEMTQAIFDRMAEPDYPLAKTHRYVLLSSECSGLGALVPMGEAGAWLRGKRDPHTVSINGKEVSA